MKILAISPTAGLSGVDQTFRYLCSGLVEQGCSVIAVLPQEAAIKQSLLDANVDVEEARHLHWWFNPGFSDDDASIAAERSRVNVRYLLRMIRAVKPDVLISNTSVMLDGIIAAMISGIPHVTHLHALFVDNIYTQMSARFKSSIYELLAGPWSDMIVPARETREQLLRLMPACGSHVHAVPNGVDLKRFVPGSIVPQPPKKTRIVSLGHFNANKNQFLLVDVACELEALGVHEFVFTLAGPAEALFLSQLKKRISEQRMGSRFQILDAQSDVLPLLQSAQIYTNCSITETFPVSVLEAMATGLPVVCTPTVGAKEIVVNGVTGLLGDDAKSLASHFARLIRNAEQRDEMGRAARARVEEFYSVDVFVRNFLSVVQKKVCVEMPQPARWLESIYFGRPDSINFDRVSRIVILVPDRNQTSFDLLIKKPFDYIKENNLDLAFEIFSYAELDGLRLDDIDVLYVFRIYADPIPEIVAQAKRRGSRVIFESDDNYFALKFENGSPIHGAVKNLAMEEILKASDQVIVYSEAMEAEVQRFSESVIRLRPYQIAQSALPKHGRNEVVGFMGSLKKDVDFEFVVPAVIRLLLERPSMCVEFFGFVPEALQGHPRVFTEDFDPRYDEFIERFHKRGWTVGLAPLADTVFNRSKTNNKYREYAAAGYAGVYSNIPPYADCVVDHISGLLVENQPEDWYFAIRTLLDDQALRGTICDNAFRDVKRKYRFDDHVATKLELLRVQALSSARGVSEQVDMHVLEAPPERHWKTPRKSLALRRKVDITNAPYREAVIGAYRGQLCAVEIAIVDFFTSHESIFGIEIVYENEIVEHIVRSLLAVERNSIVRFELRRPLLVDGNIAIRVFGRSVYGPITIAGYTSLPKFQQRPLLFLVGRKT